MLNDTERCTRLGEIRNWRYEEVNDGIRTVSINFHDLNTLLSDKDRTESLLSFLYFDTHPHWALRLEDYRHRAHTTRMREFLTELLSRSGDRASHIHARIRMDQPEASSILDALPPYLQSLGFRLSFHVTIPEMRELCASSPQRRKEFLKNNLSRAEGLFSISPPDVQKMLLAAQWAWFKEIQSLRLTPDLLHAWDYELLTHMREQWHAIVEAYVSSSMYDRGHRLPDIERRTMDGNEFCGAGGRWVHIDRNGYFHPCLNFSKERGPKKFIVGTIHCGLRRESGPFLDFSPEDMPECVSCRWNSSCGHTCLWLNWRINGDLYKTTGAVCAYEKMMRSLADSFQGFHPGHGKERNEDLCYQ